MQQDSNLPQGARDETWLGSGSEAFIGPIWALSFAESQAFKLIRRKGMTCEMAQKGFSTEFVTPQTQVSKVQRSLMLLC